MVRALKSKTGAWAQLLRTWGGYAPRNLPLGLNIYSIYCAKSDMTLMQYYVTLKLNRYHVVTTYQTIMRLPDLSSMAGKEALIY